MTFTDRDFSLLYLIHGALGHDTARDETGLVRVSCLLVSGPLLEHLRSSRMSTTDILFMLAPLHWSW